MKKRMCHVRMALAPPVAPGHPVIGGGPIPEKIVTVDQLGAWKECTPVGEETR
jgi:hypothetical protein